LNFCFSEPFEFFGFGLFVCEREIIDFAGHWVLGFCKEVQILIKYRL
jgi:hypothetical protein